MARILRSDFPGTTHHVFGRGNGKQLLFRDGKDCTFFLWKLGKLKQELDFRIFAYCLMKNHYHFAIQTAAIQLRFIMQRLLTSYARVFNDRWNTVGHPFQGRYGARRCKDDNDLRGIIRYVHMNPVEAKLTSLPQDWKWSGHHAVIRGSDPLLDSDFVLDLFGGGENGRRGYTDWLKELPIIRQRPSLDEIAASWGTEESVGLIRGAFKTAVVSELRRAFIMEALKSGYRRSAIATYLCRTPGAITLLLSRKK